MKVLGGPNMSDHKIEPGDLMIHRKIDQRTEFVLSKESSIWPSAVIVLKCKHVFLDPDHIGLLIGSSMNELHDIEPGSLMIRQLKNCEHQIEFVLARSKVSTVPEFAIVFRGNHVFLEAFPGVYSIHYWLKYE